jgi:hypothetical protein
MSTIWVVITTTFVLGVLAFLTFGLLALLFGSHADQFRDPTTGETLWESPHLEMRDEFEHTHDTGIPHLETRDEFEHGPVAAA